MVRAATCESLNRHCHHWGLSEVQHALVHVQARLIGEVEAADLAEGIPLGTGESSTSIAGDGERLERLLADEGYRVVPLGGGA